MRDGSLCPRIVNEALEQALDCWGLHLLEAGCGCPCLMMLPLQVQQRIPIMVSVSEELVGPEAHNIQKLLAQTWCYCILCDQFMPPHNIVSGGPQEGSQSLCICL